MAFSPFNDLEHACRIAKITTWTSYVTLIVSLFLDGLLSGTAPGLLIVIIIPLLIFVRGLSTPNYRSLAMLCFVSLLYFTAIVANLYEPDRSPFGIVALIAVVSLFVAAMMYSRWLRASTATVAEGADIPVDERIDSSSTIDT